jgi:hypothetical protein
MILFNTGVMVATPVGGNMGANPTPTVLGILQEGAFDVSWEVKMLYGQNQFPVDVATGKGKVSGTAKYASVTGKGISDLFFGQGTTTPGQTVAYNEGPTAIPATPFQITVVNAAKFIFDLGVTNAATGAPLVRVASGPTTGQYSVNTATGVYTFASADNISGISVVISYVYTLAATIGFRTVVANQLMGFGPNVEIDFFITYNNQQTLVRAYNSKLTKWGLPSKQGDYLIQDVAFESFANAAGNVFELDYTS